MERPVRVPPDRLGAGYRQPVDQDQLGHRVKFADSHTCGAGRFQIIEYVLRHFAERPHQRMWSSRADRAMA
ncbi:MAG: hypothetical protein M3024_03910, partial [Candidatus Dormibacteraeota bacterium]|nr:hypothetical protein [Candidatus Dormibacteraeota bacterium]